MKLQHRARRARVHCHTRHVRVCNYERKRVCVKWRRSRCVRRSWRRIKVCRRVPRTYCYRSYRRR